MEEGTCVVACHIRWMWKVTASNGKQGGAPPEEADKRCGRIGSGSNCLVAVQMVAV